MSDQQPQFQPYVAPTDTKQKSTTQQFKFLYANVPRLEKEYKSEKDPDTINVLYAFDAKNVVFGKHTRKNFGGYHVQLKYLLNDPKRGLKNVLIPLVLQPPERTTNFGINDNARFVQAGKAVSYSIDLSLNHIDYGDELRAFFNLLKSIDDNNVQQAIKQKKDWWRGTDLHDEVIPAFYTANTR